MKKLTVAVHNGVFHADETFAIAALRRIADVTVVRSRDPKVLAECNMRVDVGGEYASDKWSYDHHQPGGAGKRDNGVPYAAFGLVWRHYGVIICDDWEVAQMVDERVVQPVDAGDNGFALFTKECVDGIVPHNISAVIDSFVPSWDEEDQNFDDAFERAVEFAGTILERAIIRFGGVMLAKTMVRKAITQANDPRLVILERFCPWQEVMVEEAPNVLFVCFPSTNGGWCIQTVPEKIESFDMRRPLPEAWAGKRGADLVQLTGVSDATFCHPARFIGGAESKGGILKLAELALA